MKKEQVLKRLLGYIKDQDLHKGDKLPAERELSSFLLISRSTVREALRIMEERGWLVVKRGSGVFINQRPELFEIDEPLQSYDEEMQIRDWLEVSLLIIPTMFYRAAERMTQAETGTLVDYIIAMSRNVMSRNLEQLAELGSEFFLHLAALTGNRKYVRIMKEINQEQDMLWRYFIDDEEFLNNVIFSGYVEIVNAIKEKKPAEAFALARQNIINICDWFSRTRGHRYCEGLTISPLPNGLRVEDKVG